MKTNDVEKAKEILTKYIDIHKLERIGYYLPASFLAREIGYSNRLINKSAVVFEHIEQNMKNKVFEKYIKNKTVAVVGSGPQEVGTGNGAKIDSHDIVIRFNESKTQDEFACDYGSKINIWCAWKKFPNKYPLINCDLMVLAADIFFSRPSQLYIHKDFYSIIKKYKINNTCGIQRPTSGMQLLYWLKNLNENFSMDNVYGFSFKEDLKVRHTGHYYDSYDYKLNIDPHDLIKEKNALENLFGIQTCAKAEEAV